MAEVAPHSERIYDEIDAAFGPGELDHLIDRLVALRDRLTDETTT